MFGQLGSCQIWRKLCPLLLLVAHLLSAELVANDRRSLFSGYRSTPTANGDPFLAGAPEDQETTEDHEATADPAETGDGDYVDDQLDTSSSDALSPEDGEAAVDFMDGAPSDDVSEAAYLPEQALDLPGVDPRDETWQEPDEVFDPSAAESEPDEPSAGGPPAQRRFITDNVDGFTYLIPRDGFSVAEYDARTALVIPLFLGGPPPKLALGFGATTFETPTGFESPETLYNVQVELRWLRPINDWMALDMAVGPSWFTDFNTPASRGLRVTGRALLFMTNSETVKTAVGFVYLGREDLVAVPAVGLIYTPSEDLRYEVMIPRPRVVWRVAKSETSEHWAYLGGELFGGNSWAIDHQDGREDIFIYRDYRLLAGYEFKRTGGLSIRGEAGFVFAREARFETDPSELKPGSTGFVRAVLSY